VLQIWIFFLMVRQEEGVTTLASYSLAWWGSFWKNKDQSF
jgi:hypothetical protein